MKCFQRGKLNICITIGDITEFVGDAIVNPANTLGVMGGGVALAIKKKAGSEIEREITSKAPIPIGEAAVTSGYKLKVAKVIHAPTVTYPGERSSVANVARAVHAALMVATRNGLRKIAFPLMGAGTGRLSIEESLATMLDAIGSFTDNSLEITIYIKNPFEFDKAIDVAMKIFKNSQT